MPRQEIHDVFHIAGFAFDTLFSSEVPPASVEYSWTVLIPNDQLYRGSLIRLFYCGTFLGFMIHYSTAQQDSNLSQNAKTENEKTSSRRLGPRAEKG